MAIFGPNPQRMARKGDVAGLLGLLRGSDETLRDQAADALAGMGRPAVDALVTLLRQPRAPFTDDTWRWGVSRTATHALVRMPEPPVADLLGWLEDDEYDIREVAVDALGEIGDKRAVEPLMRVLERHDGPSRGAIRALGELGDIRAVEPIIPFLRVRDALTRQIAAQALGRLGDRRAIDPLVAAVKDKDKDVREAAAEALRRFDDDRATEAAHEANVRALRDLGAFGPELDEFEDSGPISVRLTHIAERMRVLPLDHPTNAVVAGTGTGAGSDMLTTVTETCEVAARAVATGLDPAGNPITGAQVASGLRALVSDMRASVGLLYTAVDAEGVQLFERALQAIESAAGELERP